MKILVIIGVLFAVAVADDVHGIKAARDNCQENPATHVDVEDVKKWRTNPETEPPKNLKAHQRCVLHNLHILNDEGKLVTDQVKTHVQHTFSDEAKVNDIVEKCAIEKDTPEDTAAAVSMCMYKAGVFAGQHIHDHGHDHDHVDHHN